MNPFGGRFPRRSDILCAHVSPFVHWNVHFHGISQVASLSVAHELSNSSERGEGAGHFPVALLRTKPCIDTWGSGCGLQYRFIK